MLPWMCPGIVFCGFTLMLPHFFYCVSKSEGRRIDGVIGFTDHKAFWGNLDYTNKAFLESYTCVDIFGICLCKGLLSKCSTGAWNASLYHFFISLSGCKATPYLKAHPAPWQPVFCCGITAKPESAFLFWWKCCCLPSTSSTITFFVYCSPFFIIFMWAVSKTSTAFPTQNQQMTSISADLVGRNRFSACLLPLGVSAGLWF